MDDSILQRGTVLKGNKDSYVIKKQLAQGGVGTVFIGQRISDRQEVAIKMLHGGRFPITDIARIRFRKEIELALLISHPNIVRSYDYGLHSGQDFFVMEYVVGGTIAQRIQKKDYSDSTAFKWCAEILSGLSYLHKNNYIHRDLKPNNILLTPQGSAKIADMGILRDMSADAYLTLSGDQMGSVLYISRSQRDHPDSAGPSDDAYSACCCFYEILSRQRIHVFPQHLFDATDGTIPRYVCDLIMGCLSGLEGEATLHHLQECFEIDQDGDGRLSSLATSDALNERIVLLTLKARHAGLVRRRFAQHAPLNFIGDMKLPEGGRCLIDYLDETTIIAVEGNDYESGRQLMRLISIESNGLRQVGEAYVMSPRDMVVVPTRMIVLAGRSGIETYSCGKGFLLVGQNKWHEIELGGNFYALDLARHPSRPIAAIVSPGDNPIILDVGKGKFFKIQAIQIPDKGRYPKVCFVGDQWLAVYVGEEILVCHCDFDTEAVTIARRIPFSIEVLALSGTRSGESLFIGHVQGMTAENLIDHKKSWSLPSSTNIVWEVETSPNDLYVAGKFGDGGLGAGRVALFESSGGAMAYLPDQGETDSLRQSAYIAWSPSGERLAVTDYSGYLTVFQKSSE